MMTLLGSYSSSSKTIALFALFAEPPFIINYIILFSDHIYRPFRILVSYIKTSIIVRLFRLQIIHRCRIIFNQRYYNIMLKGDPNEGLLKSSVGAQSPANKEKTSQSQLEEEEDAPVKSNIKKSKKEHRSEVTYILKTLNLLVGFAFVAFASYCYYDGFDSLNIDAQILKYVMPGYIGLSGLVILLIECRVAFMIRNMKFLYNYFGRGLFNIYAGAMPLMLIKNFDNPLNTFQIIALVASSIMCLVGVLYICLKIFCCQKEGARIDYNNKASNSDSD